MTATATMADSTELLEKTAPTPPASDELRSESSKVDGVDQGEAACPGMEAPARVEQLIDPKPAVEPTKVLAQVEQPMDSRPVKELTKTNGSTWICLFDGKPWPVVLCDDRELPQAFLGSRSDSHVRPAILLGKHK